MVSNNISSIGRITTHTNRHHIYIYIYVCLCESEKPLAKFEQKII